MSNGYGHKTAVSPAAVSPVSQGGYGYSYGFATPFPGAGAPIPTPFTGAAAGMMPSMMPMPMPPMPPMVPNGSFVTPQGTTVVTAAPQMEESYVENILRLNRGKLGTFYMTYENNREWNAKIFRGIIEAAGRDHIIISDPTTGMRYLLLMLNLDYVTFDGPINYEYPFAGGTITNQTPVTPVTPATPR
ncbi:spore coat protein GerQ [Paenibacillus curdlanolyticus YK9]|uniref:Spore coat protein GerQ n=1 Tax=Paenibacillus curdlanolyticus YK9 TaxID=717606 RepID=E0IFP6_9BACL|nr:spore coat protein GerQ [Paenibacillus curdlanolyticus]EFM08712.1 spore coat protein GerQ [Paenibacillus curdlanolyticus YK9]